MPLHLNIVARTNGVGLDQDVDLIREVAKAAGHRVTVSHCRSISPLAGLLPRRPRFDLNIFLERTFPRWFRQAKANILIPNQERFPARHLSRLRKIDHIFCKSQHAKEVFSQHHSSCIFTGFASRDLNDPQIPRQQNTFFHLAGRSTLKGTETILEAWRRHPQWPTLTLLQATENAPNEVPKNVNLVSDYVTNEDLIRMANEHPIHLCPSLSEGWGHYIVEAMSCGAVIITTDGPPMNELVTSERGFLIPSSRQEPRHLGVNYHVSAEDLAKAVEQVLAMDRPSQESLGAAARAWTLENKSAFAERFRHALDEVSRGL